MLYLLPVLVWWFWSLISVHVLSVRREQHPWSFFAAVQGVSSLAMVAGWILLIPFCLAQDWSVGHASIKDGRLVDYWSWSTLNWVYGNPEDGVSGKYALVWKNGIQVAYMANAWAPWRAYVWSGWRNSADNLKYVYSWRGGPWRRFTATVFGRQWYAQAGWNTSGLPTVSAGRA